MTPWLLKHSPGFSSILIYTGPAGVAKAHVHRLCSRSLLLGVFLEKLQPRGCEGEGKNRKGKSAWSYGYFSYPVTGVSGKDFQQRSCLCVSDFIHKADFFFFFSSARVCVCVRTHVWALHRSLISLKSCLFSRFAPTTNISLIKATEKACHFKQSTHTRTHANTLIHPNAALHVVMATSLTLHRPSRSYCIRRANREWEEKDAKGRQEHVTVSAGFISHVQVWFFAVGVKAATQLLWAAHVCRGFHWKNSLPLFGFTAAAFLPFRQLHNSPIF